MVAVLLAALFLLSASLNLGVRIQLGPVALGFQVPSSSIAGFEILIAIVLVAGVLIPNLYLLGAAYLLAAVGVIEGLLSPEVQGLARTVHEVMIPLLVLGWVLTILEISASHKARAKLGQRQSMRTVITVLQFFNGGLVTFGGAAYVISGARPFGTLIGAGHLTVGLIALAAGYVFLRRARRSEVFVVWANVATIAYSTIAEVLAEVYALLPPGINDALIGTVIAVGVSVVILYVVPSAKGC